MWVWMGEVQVLTLIQEISDREDVVVKQLLESERQKREQKLLQEQLRREREALERQKRMEEEAAAAAAEAEAWRRCASLPSRPDVCAAGARRPTHACGGTHVRTGAKKG
jgi:membrane protein involved in colicin uptake